MTRNRLPKQWQVPKSRTVKFGGRLSEYSYDLPLPETKALEEKIRETKTGPSPAKKRTMKLVGTLLVLTSMATTAGVWYILPKQTLIDHLLAAGVGWFVLMVMGLGTIITYSYIYEALGPD